MSTSATTRRTLAKSAVWAAPVVAMAVAAPAAAASGDCTGCWTLNWDDPATGTASFLANVSPDPATSTSYSKDWTRTGALSAPAAGGGCPILTASVAQKRITGSYKGLASTTRTNTDSDFSIGNTGRLANTAETPVTIDTDGVNGLVLSQATTINSTGAAEESVIFTFSAPVQTVSFKIYDFTRNTATASSGTNINNYADSVSFNKSTTVTDATASGFETNATWGSNVKLTCTTGCTPALSVSINGLTNYAYREGNYQTISPGESNRNADVVVAMGGATSFQMNYRNAGTTFSGPRGGNAQWIVIGDLQVCF
jgi:hypothetical protein